MFDLALSHRYILRSPLLVPSCVLRLYCCLRLTDVFILVFKFNLSQISNRAGVEVDVSSPASVARLASLAKDHLGGVDVWINNAGYSGSFQVSVDAVCHPQGFFLLATTEISCKF